MPVKWRRIDVWFGLWAAQHLDQEPVWRSANSLKGEIYLEYCKYHRSNYRIQCHHFIP